MEHHTGSDAEVASLRVDAGLGAAWLSWDAAAAQGEANFIISLFVINGVFHFAWSPLFFTLKRPDWALIEVPYLWGSVLALAIFLCDLAVLSSWIFVPYLVRVSFAACLDWKIVQLNKPFGAQSA